MVDQADAPLAPWYGPEYMLRRLAALNRDGSAQALAAGLEAAGAVNASAVWLNFVWFDPGIPAAREAAPLRHHLTDLGMYVGRAGDGEQAAMLVMRAGPPFGRRAQSEHIVHDLGAGHIHPDINHITLFAGGEFLLRDDGYAGRKDTAQHNTLLVGGQGQVGAGGEWTRYPHYPLPEPQSALSLRHSDAAMDYVLGEGAAAYSPATGLRRFDRHVVFIRPDILVVVDELEAAGPAEFALLWHPGAPFAPAAEGDGRESRIGRMRLGVQIVTPERAAPLAAQRSFVGHDRKPAALEEMTTTLKGPRTACGTLFTWAAEGAGLPKATLSRQGEAWLIEAGGRRVRLLPAERRLAAA